MKSLNQTLIMHTKAGALQCETKRLFCMRTTSRQEFDIRGSRVVDFDVRFSQVKETDTARVKTAATAPTATPTATVRQRSPVSWRNTSGPPFRRFLSVPPRALLCALTVRERNSAEVWTSCFSYYVRVFSDVAHCFRMVR